MAYGSPINICENEPLSTKTLMCDVLKPGASPIKNEWKIDFVELPNIFPELLHLKCFEPKWQKIFMITFQSHFFTFFQISMEL